jgi:hypothetical protein
MFYLGVLSSRIAFLTRRVNVPPFFQFAFLRRPNVAATHSYSRFVQMKTLDKSSIIGKPLILPHLFLIYRNLF